LFAERFHRLRDFVAVLRADGDRLAPEGDSFVADFPVGLCRNSHYLGKVKVIRTEFLELPDKPVGIRAGNAGILLTESRPIDSSGAKQVAIADAPQALDFACRCFPGYQAECLLATQPLAQLELRFVFDWIVQNFRLVSMILLNGELSSRAIFHPIGYKGLQKNSRELSSPINPLSVPIISDEA
jgi:hypothetical protein